MKGAEIESMIMDEYADMLSEEAEPNDNLPKTPDEFQRFMRDELKRYREELGLTKPPGQNGIPLPSTLKRGEHLIRNRTRLPEAASLDEAMKKAGVSRKGRRAYLASQRQKKSREAKITA